MPLLASEVMDDAAAVYLNDSAKSRWTYAIMLPYLRAAIGELQAELESNDLPPLYEISTFISVPIGDVELQLPADFVFPVLVEERGAGETRFTKMDEQNWDSSEPPTAQLRYWSFREGKIQFIGATSIRTIRLRYLRSLSAVTTESSVIEVANARQFYAARLAALASNFGGSATARATMADQRATYFLRLCISSLTKRLQDRPVRRRRYQWR